MDQTRVAKRFQTPDENLLMDIGILAKQTSGLIDLSIGDPDLNTEDAIIEYAMNAAKEGHTHYTLSDGSEEFRQAVADFYQRTYQMPVDKNQVRATVGVSHGLYLALMAILDPGDEVIIHEPYFSPYKDQVELAEGVPVIVPTYEKDGFQLDPEVLAKAITPKTKAIILNNPNNPTGAVFSEATCQAIADLAIQHDLFILSDEIYEAFSFDQPFYPMATFAPEHTITFSGFSKAFAMTGWRIGYMISPVFVNDVARYLNENISYSANALSQQGAIYALEHAEEIIPSVVKIFKERLAYVESRVAQHPRLEMNPVKGTMYAYINVKKTKMNALEFTKVLLEEAKVLVIPGDAFSETKPTTHIRIAVTQDIEQLKEAFDRIDQCV